MWVEGGGGERGWDKTEIYMYARLGSINHPLKVFSEIPDHEKKVVDWNVMIEPYDHWLLILHKKLFFSKRFVL